MDPESDGWISGPSTELTYPLVRSVGSSAVPRPAVGFSVRIEMLVIVCKERGNKPDPHLRTKKYNCVLHNIFIINNY